MKTATKGRMASPIEAMEVEVKEEPADNQVSSSHLPSSSGLNRFRDADTNSHPAVSPTEDPLKVKEEPPDGQPCASPAASPPRRTSGTGRRSSRPEDAASQSGSPALKEEDICIKEEPVEDFDRSASNTTTFTPRTRGSGKVCIQVRTKPQTSAGGSAAPSVDAGTRHQRASPHSGGAARHAGFRCQFGEEGCCEGGVTLAEQLPSSGPEQLTISKLEDQLPSFGLEGQLPGWDVEQQQSHSGRQQIPSSGEGNLPSTSASSACLESPASVPAVPRVAAGPSRISTDSPSTSNKRRRSESCDPVDRALSVLCNYLEKKNKPVDFPFALGQLVESAARKLPWSEQLGLAAHIISFVSDGQERKEIAK